ncbi:O-antigen polysaccharide polymerase Wzy family protein [Peptoniphilaceae bacterium SGI.131]
MIKIVKKLNFIGVIFDLLTIMCFTSLAFNRSNLMVYTAFGMLLFNALLSFKNLKDHIIYLCFNVSLGFFLLSRFIVTAVFGYSFEYGGLYDMGFNDLIAVQIIKLILISIYTYSFTYIALNLKEFIQEDNKSLIFKFLSKILLTDKKNKSKEIKENKKYILILRYLALGLFVVSVSLRLYLLFENYMEIREIGYRASYLIDKSHISFFRKLLDIFSRMELASFIVFVSTKPKLKNVVIFSALFIAPALLLMITGARAEIILRIMLVASVVVSRLENKKLIKKMMIVLGILVPIFILIFIIVESRRGTGAVSAESNSYLTKFMRFLYGQGVSARAIGSSIQFRGELGNKIYSFSEVTDFFKFSVFGRLKGIKMPQGQSIDVVLNRSELSHVLSFVQNPFDYLNKGLGVGSSYIAELFLDFSYIGVIVGSVFYGFVMKGLSKSINSSNLAVSVISLMITKNLFFTPRASFSFLLRDLLTETQIFTILLLFLGAFVMDRFIIKKEFTVREG